MGGINNCVNVLVFFGPSESCRYLHWGPGESVDQRDGYIINN